MKNSPRSPRRLLAAFVAGVTAVVLAVGGGAAYAYWTATAGGEGSLTTGTSVSITQTGFSALGKTFINNTYAPANATNTLTLGNTGVLTVKNGLTAGQVSVAISDGGAIGSSLPLQMWPVASAAACTLTSSVGTPTTTGTWASATTAPVAIAANATIYYCVRTTVPNRATLAVASGTQQGSSSVVATLTTTATGNWAPATSATDATSVALNKTEGIYPLSGGMSPATGSRWFTVMPAGNSARCADVSGSGGAGTVVLVWGCVTGGFPSASTNRVWQLVPDNANRDLITLRPLHAPTTRMSAAGSAVVIAAANAADTQQKWYVQVRNAGTYQLVSAYDGRCVSMPLATGDLSLVNCNDASANLAISQSAPIAPVVTGTGNVRIAVGFSRESSTSATYSARIISATNLVTPCSNSISGTIDAAKTTITCPDPGNAGTYTVEVYSGTTSTIIHRVTIAFDGNNVTSYTVLE